MSTKIKSFAVLARRNALENIAHEINEVLDELTRLANSQQADAEDHAELDRVRSEFVRIQNGLWT